MDMLTIIHADLANIIMSYIGNFVQNSGLHTIMITAHDVINKMLKTECGPKFEIESFISELVSNVH